MGSHVVAADAAAEAAVPGDFELLGTIAPEGVNLLEVTLVRIVPNRARPGVERNLLRA